jgi:Mlc titration factor MtfA (ptsG expression regulator)
MFDFLRDWRRRRAAARIDAAEWRATVANLPLLDGLSTAELEQLRELASRFLGEKSLEPAGGLELAPEMGPLIAAQACLPILHLGLDYYRDWYSLILYPEGFLAHHEYTDADGLVHKVHRPLIGEAWERGPVILSWADILDTLDAPGLNVVIHEMAHKLDMLNGAVNGMPPLHRDMHIDRWSRSFNRAYRHLCRQVDSGQPTALDPYAAESPGEFLAVASELFFTMPGTLATTYPAVYRQLAAFYRQDPLARFMACGRLPAAPAPAGPEPEYD